MLIMRCKSAVSEAALAVGIVLLLSGCGNTDKLDALRADALTSALASSNAVLHLASGDTLHISESTLDFYRDGAGQTAWVDSKRLLATGAALHDAIGRAWEDGLPPDRYRHDVAGALIERIGGKDQPRTPDSLMARHLAELDILVTEGFNRFSVDLVTGMLKPQDAGLEYLIHAGTPPDAAVLRRALAGEKPADIVAGLRPSIPHYERLRTVLLAFHASEAAGDWPLVVDRKELKEGDRGEEVTQWRLRLVAGADAQEATLARAGAADPALYDAELKLAIQHFQDRHGIEPDGVVGPTTAKELNHTRADWIAELRLNLDRWRWLPNELGDRYVLVNIAGFEMEVVEAGKVIESMNVVVGQRTTQTPIFADSIRYVVVNPYWNVPDGIMERTIRPAMALDPNYLANHDMEWADGRLRQRPGPQNSLGRYKFIFPNDHDVYLHDTPDGHLFARTERAFSSGCVRIERPRDFARLLLGLQSDQDPESLDAIRAAGSEKWIKLDRPLPVFILYLTAWAQEDGSIRFHHDVYGRSGALDGQAEEMKSPVSPEA
jgi:L,D-transpeptidase YcbB